MKAFRCPAIERMTDDQLFAAMDKAARRKQPVGEDMAAIWREFRMRQSVDEKWGRGEPLTEREKKVAFR